MDEYERGLIHGAALVGLIFLLFALATAFGKRQS